MSLTGGNATESMEGMLRGAIVRGMGGLYTARTPDGAEYVLRCKKKFRRMRMSPLVGDEILFTPGVEEEHGWVEEILPRKTECLRPPVANVELLLIVVAPVPAPDLMLVDRLLVRARQQELNALLVVNKCDVDGQQLAKELSRQYARTEVPVYAVSAQTRTGMEELREAMRGRLCCFTGQSGVGKSTLLNALTGLRLETGDISEKIQRGKNTTRHAELLEADGLRVLDTAGFSLLEMEDNMDPVTLKEVYPEFYPYEGQCRFNPCYHASEPGCAVTAAVEVGELPPERVERYRALLEDVRKAWKERYD